MDTTTYLTLDKEERSLRRSDVDALAAQIGGGNFGVVTSFEIGRAHV
jgi:hypothetical protein